MWTQMIKNHPKLSLWMSFCSQCSSVTDLEDSVVHQYDGLKGRSTFIGQLMERLLFPPVFLLQRVTDDTRGAAETRTEAEGDIWARLGATAARQVYLKPAERNTQYTWVSALVHLTSDLNDQGTKAKGSLWVQWSMSTFLWISVDPVV